MMVTGWQTALSVILGGACFALGFAPINWFVGRILKY